MLGSTKSTKRDRSTPNTIINISSTSKKEVSDKTKKKPKKTVTVIRKQPLFDPDDDDFVSAPPFAQSRPTLAEPKPIIQKPISNNNEGLLTSRYPPSKLIDMVKGFNDVQKQAIIDMGFGFVFQCVVKGFPRDFCYWLLKSFDPVTCSLQVDDLHIYVTRQSVHDILGLPLGSVPIKLTDRTRSTVPLIRLFKEQFPPKSRIRLKNLVEVISKYNDADEIFIIDFLVGYVSIMIHCPKLGTINQGFLESIKPDINISDYDWCGFVIQSLKQSATRTKTYESQFTGPIAFLALLYLHCTHTSEYHGERKSSALSFWTPHEITKRLSRETINGGYGNVHILKDYSEEYLEEQDHILLASRIKHTKRKRMDDFQYVKKMKKVDTSRQDSDDEFQSCDDRTPNHMHQSLQQFIEALESDFFFYNKSMENIDDRLKQAWDCYPGSEQLKDYLKMRNEQFNRFHPMMVLPESCIKTAQTHEVRVPQHEFSPGVLTQILNNPETCDQLEREAIATISNSSKGKPHSSPFTPIPFICNQLVTTAKLPVQDQPARPRPQRITKPSAMLCSPYFDRVVDANSLLGSVEDKVSGTIFLAAREIHEIIFRTNQGDQLLRGVIESMIPGSEVHVSVIDVWSSVLNDLERFKDQKSRSRFFMPCSLLTNIEFNKKDATNVRFCEKVNEFLQRYPNVSNLKKITLVFSP